MTSSTASIQDFLATTPPFDRLSPVALQQLAAKVQPLRYRMGQAIVMRGTMPAQIAILYEGQARSVVSPPHSQLPDTLQLLRPGAILGWASLLRGVACETGIASVESVCLTLLAKDFRALLQSEPEFAHAFHNQVDPTELFDLLGAEVQRQAIGEVDLKALTLQLVPDAKVLTLPQGKTPLSQLDPNLLWLLSGGTTNFTIGSQLDDPPATLLIDSPSARLIGIPNTAIRHQSFAASQPLTANSQPLTADIPFAPERPTALEDEEDTPSRKAKYPHVHGKGEIDGALACFQMLSQLWKMPFRRDVMRRALVNQDRRSGSISLQFCGAIGELMGLNAQLATVPAAAITRLQTPVMLGWEDSFALLYKASEKELVLAIPSQGIRRWKPAALMAAWGEEGEVLLLQPTKDTPQQKFGLSWFIPSVIRYRKVLIEVLLASFFVQLFGLANPLITQVIIDKVIVQKGATR